jgi:hypothetical protein
MNKEIKNHIKIISLLIVVFIILYFLHVTIGDRFEDQYDTSDNDSETNIIFMKNFINKTLTVSEIHSQRKTIYWTEIELKEGNATLPPGIIDVGDEITNCEDNIVIVWKSTDTYIYSTNFN